MLRFFPQRPSLSAALVLRKTAYWPFCPPQHRYLKSQVQVKQKLSGKSCQGCSGSLSLHARHSPQVLNGLLINCSPRLRKCYDNDNVLLLSSLLRSIEALTLGFKFCGWLVPLPRPLNVNCLHSQYAGNRTGMDSIFICIVLNTRTQTSCAWSFLPGRPTLSHLQSITITPITHLSIFFCDLAWHKSSYFFPRQCLLTHYEGGFRWRDMNFETAVSSQATFILSSTITVFLHSLMPQRSAIQWVSWGPRACFSSKTFPSTPSVLIQISWKPGPNDSKSPSTLLKIGTIFILISKQIRMG